jgi:hypothetical protein
MNKILIAQFNIPFIMTCTNKFHCLMEVLIKYYVDSVIVSTGQSIKCDLHDQSLNWDTKAYDSITENENFLHQV